MTPPLFGRDPTRRGGSYALISPDCPGKPDRPRGGGGYATFPSVPSGIRHCPGQSIRIRKRIRTRLNACSLRATAIPLGKRTPLNAGGSQKCFQNAFKLNPGVLSNVGGSQKCFQNSSGLNRGCAFKSWS